MESETPLPEVLKHGLSVEQKLLCWRANLPTELKRRPWSEQSEQLPGQDPVFDKLSAIIHLRYLNVSLLRHRAILDRYLDSLENQRHIAGAQDPFFLDFAQHSLKVSQESAVEIVDIVSKMSYHSAALGAWWFSAYYTFNASLVMYGCILVLFSLSKQRHCQSNIAIHTERQYKMNQMIASLNIAVTAIERVGKGTRTAKGIRRTLIKIISISKRLSQLQAVSHPTIELVNNQRGTEDSQAIIHPDIPQQEQTLDDVDSHVLCPTGLQFGGHWDVPEAQLWTGQTDFDIFADLGSLDVGLGSFMAA